jgi:ribosomal protein L27
MSHQIMHISAGSDNPIVGVLKKDNCFVSSGGILHRKGITWYEGNTVGGKVCFK